MTTRSEAPQAACPLDRKVRGETMEWQPWETRPRDGRQFICWNGKEMGIFNEPPKCALGRWTKIGKHWSGYFERFYNPTHWMPLPEFPSNV